MLAMNSKQYKNYLLRLVSLSLQIIYKCDSKQAGYHIAVIIHIYGWDESYFYSTIKQAIIKLLKAIDYERKD